MYGDNLAHGDLKQDNTMLKRLDRRPGLAICVLAFARWMARYTKLSLASSVWRLGNRTLDGKGSGSEACAHSDSV